MAGEHGSAVDVALGVYQRGPEGRAEPGRRQAFSSAPGPDWGEGWGVTAYEVPPLMSAKPCAVGRQSFRKKDGHSHC